MNNKDKLLLLRDRENRLKNSKKNIESGGVLRRVRRQIRNLEKGE